MRLLALASIALAALGQPAGTAADPFAALWVYSGSWQVTTNGRPTQKPDTLTNQCAALGKYFACAQTVNGQAGGLLVFVQTAKAGHFYTQTIMPEGRATGRDDLDISGNQWTYSSRRDEGGKTTFYRNVNTFSGKARIHFEQSESTNATNWVVKNSGDEARVGAAPRH